MRIAAIALLLLTVAGGAYAWDSATVTAPGPVDLPEVREAFYCQQPSTSWNANNASVAFSSEMADGIPATYAGTNVTEVTLYVAEWGAGWTNPQGMIVNFYNASCPPSFGPDANYSIPWAQCTSSLVYNGSWFVYQVQIPLGGVYTLGSTSSVGGLVDQNWGQNAPYCGLVFCDAIAGCEGYWAGDYWGYPRWTPFSAYFGYGMDLGYCLHNGAVPTKDSTWGNVKSLYR